MNVNNLQQNVTYIAQDQSAQTVLIHIIKVVLNRVFSRCKFINGIDYVYIVFTVEYNRYLELNFLIRIFFSKWKCCVKEDKVRNWHSNCRYEADVLHSFAAYGIGHKKKLSEELFKYVP